MNQRSISPEKSSICTDFSGLMICCYNLPGLSCSFSFVTLHVPEVVVATFFLSTL